MKGWGSKILDNRIMAWNWDNEREFAVSVVVGGIDCETKSKTKTKLKWIDSEICWGKCVWVWGEGGEKERIDQFKILTHLTSLLSSLLINRSVMKVMFEMHFCVCMYGNDMMIIYLYETKKKGWDDIYGWMDVLMNGW